MGLDPEDGQIDVEDVLRRWDPVDVEETNENGLAVVTSTHRLRNEAKLIGFSKNCLEECLPGTRCGRLCRAVQWAARR